MKRLNNHGLSLVEVVVTFAIVMAIISGLMSVIMHYRLRAQNSLSELELQTYKNTLTKAIQDDILTFGISEINHGGSCTSSTNQNRFSSCANFVFKNGAEKILAVSKMEQDDVASLENKYIYYDDEKYTLSDTIPKKIPTGRHAFDFQTIFISTENFLSSDSTVLADGSSIRIYSIDIPIEHVDYEQDFGLHIVASDADHLTANAMTSEFRFTESVQEFTAPADGSYRIELWGASGGNAGPYTGGQGSYTGGYITLKKNQMLYVYVGGEGTAPTGGYNGGGAVATGQENYGASGGGATDVRLVGGDWNSFDSLKSRIMVAAGGGGANHRNVTSETDQKLYGSGNGGAGGGLWGYDGVSESFQSSDNVGYTSMNFHSIGGGGTQVLGGTKNGYDNTSLLLSSAITGGFGSGSTLEQSGGGGGWYTGSQSSNGGAGGGSSYISGHLGCKAINQNSVINSISHRADSEYDSYVFTNTTMIDGEGYSWTSNTQPTQKQSMPNNGVSTINDGNVGDGFARITYLGL